MVCGLWFVVCGLWFVFVADRDGLIRHALLALRECLPSDGELTAENVTISIVGKDEPVAVMMDEAVQPYLDAMV